MSAVAQPQVPPAALSRRDVAGASSARGLIFTLLGEFVLPHGGMAWTSAMIAAMSRLGVEEKATRQALMRVAADGWLTAERVGRRTRWHLTPTADRLLTEGTERIYSFGARRDGWEGTWLLVLARTPETERPARHVLRSRLMWAGFGSPAPGVWISTHAGRLREVERALAEAGPAGDAQVFVGTHAGGQLTALIGQAWDLAALSQLYDDFRATFQSVAAADQQASLIRLVHAWRRFPWTDPDLPTDLLPQHWPRPQAAEIFRQRHAQWSPAATAAWRQMSAPEDRDGA